jgi:hypothetical protein
LKYYIGIKKGILLFVESSQPSHSGFDSTRNCNDLSYQLF